MNGNLETQRRELQRIVGEMERLSGSWDAVVIQSTQTITALSNVLTRKVMLNSSQQEHQQEQTQQTEREFNEGGKEEQSRAIVLKEQEKEEVEKRREMIKKLEHYRSSVLKSLVLLRDIADKMNRFVTFSFECFSKCCCSSSTTSNNFEEITWTSSNETSIIEIVGSIQFCAAVHEREFWKKKRLAVDLIESEKTENLDNILQEWAAVSPEKNYSSTLRQRALQIPRNTIH